MSSAESKEDSVQGLVAGASDDGASKNSPDSGRIKVVYKLRDKNPKMVAAWEDMFKDHKENVEISKGDIFKGGPQADALVSPANSFGFMDGGIDMVYSLHFGWQLQERLQKVIRQQHHGELIVGDAITIPTFEGGTTEDSMDWSECNEGKPIKFLISAPTMRIPKDIPNTINAYSAFRAVIISVEKHNSNPNNDPIRSVLCPGLGTAVGRMSNRRSAFQMLQAYEIFYAGLHSHLLAPDDLYEMYDHHYKLIEFEN